MKSTHADADLEVWACCAVDSWVMPPLARFTLTYCRRMFELSQVAPKVPRWGATSGLALVSRETASSEVGSDGEIRLRVLPPQPCDDVSRETAASSGPRSHVLHARGMSACACAPEISHGRGRTCRT